MLTSQQNKAVFFQGKTWLIQGYFDAHVIGISQPVRFGKYTDSAAPKVCSFCHDQINSIVSCEVPYLGHYHYDALCVLLNVV